VTDRYRAANGSSRGTPRARASTVVLGSPLGWSVAVTIAVLVAGGLSSGCSDDGVTPDCSKYDCGPNLADSSGDVADASQTLPDSAVRDSGTADDDADVADAGDEG
jgi:hypothetical protein